MNALIPKTIASLLLLAGAAGAVCAQAQGAAPAASSGGPVTTELPAPPLRLSEQPRIRSAVIAMVGYARGSYTEADTLIAQQVLEGMRSRHDITRTVWPDGRKVIASVNGGDHGEERAAMLLDAEGRLVALGLVNGHCNVPPTGDKPKVCKPAPQTVLSIFQPAGAKQADAEPLVVWGKTLPEFLAAMADSDDPAKAADAQKIASVEYIAGQPDVPGWRVEQLPPGFPASLRPLLVQTAEVNSTASAGKIVMPKGLAGKPMRTAYEQSQRNEPRLPDAEVTLRSYAELGTLVDAYRELAKGASVEEGGREIVFNGTDGAGRYSVRLRDAKETGVFITVSSWKRK
ncbi:hypothetical protein [Variovorax sp. EL159]|uniref:hypothetical protein n=1 Tax=Variovorax sp. EL159 TaxID=1566270 RepID=UPI00088E66DB|nr:hypothetical protein [Variovorax sp. EL159]SCX43419.1 hypothetical protein SAMN03159363_0654 [Variovorax sp. EL159]